MIGSRPSLIALAGLKSGSGCSDADIEAAEIAFGGRMPEQFRRFLRTAGWIDGGDQVYGLGADVPQHVSLLRNADWEWRHGGLYPRLLPIMPDGTGNHYCLELRVAESAVYFYDHEDSSVDRYADDFDSFLEAKLAQRCAWRAARNAT